MLRKLLLPRFFPSMVSSSQLKAGNNSTLAQSTVENRSAFMVDLLEGFTSSKRSVDLPVSIAPIRDYARDTRIKKILMGDGGNFRGKVNLAFDQKRPGDTPYVGRQKFGAWRGKAFRAALSDVTINSTVIGGFTSGIPKVRTLSGSSRSGYEYRIVLAASRASDTFPQSTAMLPRTMDDAVAFTNDPPGAASRADRLPPNGRGIDKNHPQLTRRCVYGLNLPQN